MGKMGIGRDSWHKRRKTGGRKPQMHKKRKFELGRPAANTKIAPKRVHTVRAMGGNMKFRALRLDHGNFGWASEGVARSSRIVDVVYNATSNEFDPNQNFGQRRHRRYRCQSLPTVLRVSLQQSSRPKEEPRILRGREESHRNHR